MRLPLRFSSAPAVVNVKLTLLSKQDLALSERSNNFCEDRNDIDPERGRPLGILTR